MSANIIINLQNPTRNTYSINFPEQTECDILVVGGGGSGGQRDGGGGGAGGIVFAKNVIIPSGTYAITTGKGGDAIITDATEGNDGSPSSFLGAVALGGGGGGRGDSSGNNPNGRNGGCGGGGGYDDPRRTNNGSTIQNTDKTTYGNLYTYTTDTVNNFIIYGKDGGKGNIDGTGDSDAMGGGGGGAGAVGYDGNSSGNEGVGGVGVDFSITFTTNVGVSGFFGGGGGGGGDNSAGNGGLGEGGNGGGLRGGGPLAQNATNNTGGGGGGVQWAAGSASDPSGAGGSGIVIIRYKYTKAGTLQPITINSDYKYFTFPRLDNTFNSTTLYNINFQENTEVELLILSNTRFKVPASVVIIPAGKINILVGGSGSNSSFGSISTAGETTPYNSYNSAITGTTISYNQAIVIVRYKYTRPIIQPIIIDNHYKYISFPNYGTNQTQYFINFQENTEVQLLLLDGLKYIENAPFITSGNTTINVGVPSTYDTYNNKYKLYIL